MFGQWFVFIVFPSGAERKASCALYDHKACLDWVSRWKSAGEKFENDTFRIVNLGA